MTANAKVRFLAKKSAVNGEEMRNLDTMDKKTGSKKCKIGIRIATPTMFTKKNMASCLKIGRERESG
jgi:hypothetical protein